MDPKTNRKLKRFLLLLVLFSFCIIFSSAVSAQCVTPVDDLTINSDTVLCNGTYYINDAGSTGVIIFGTNGVNLTCNNTLIIGDNNGAGIYTNTADNIVLQGCNVSNYYNGVYSWGSDDSIFRNIISFNNSYDGIVIRDSDDNIIVDSSFFNNSNDGFLFWDAFRNNFSHSTSFNNTDYGVSFLNSDDNILINISSFDNGIYGLYIYPGSDSNIIDSSSFYSNDDDGLFLRDSNYNNFTNCSFNDNVDDGIYVYEAHYSTFTNVSFFNNGGDGAWFRGSDYNKIYNSTFYNNTNYGIFFSMLAQNSRHSIVWYSSFFDNLRGAYLFGTVAIPIENNTFINCSFFSNSFGIYLAEAYENVFINSTSYNNTGDGVVISGGADNRFENCVVFDNGDDGLFIDSGDRNNFTDCTFYNNTYGVYITSSANQNLFYRNDFSSSRMAHAYSGASNNYFNITNTGKAAGYQAEGNYWDDILTLDILDSDGDGYGDSGNNYPYNSTKGGNVSGYVNDWGPEMPPYMSIYGYNGTELAGSRNVMLRIYNSDLEPDICRFANDDQSNLASSPWEECTTVKAWILSAGYGDKLVYAELKEIGGETIILNDSITYRYIQDYTPPTAPTVYDSLNQDIDWSSSNTTLSANWFNATEDISTINYKYRILNNSACYNADCNWTDVGDDTEVTVTGLTLQEGWNCSFEVMAYNPFGFNATATSNGTTIDLTDPAVPSLNSSSHPDETRHYDESTAIFTFNSTDPVSNSVSSGIAGYSYVLDRHPGSAPDNTVEERTWNTLAAMHKGSYNQTIKSNSTGPAFAVFSQLGIDVTENETIQVKVALGEQTSDHLDEMGVKVYLAKLPNNAVVGDFAFDLESDAITNIENLTQDILYADDMTLSTTYQFDLTINETVDDSTNDIYVVVAGRTDDDDNTNTLAIAGTTTLSLVDNTTNNFVCDESNNCNENTSTLEYAIEVKRQDSGTNWTVEYPYLGDATYYFHVKAQDNAGNWGGTVHYKIMVAAGGVSSMIYSPVDGELFITNGTETNITVKVAVSGNASVYVVALHPDGNNYTSSPPVVTSTTYSFENITVKLGDNELYAVTNTSAGAISHSLPVEVTVSAEPQPPTDKTLRVSYSGCAITESYLCNILEGTSYVGIATENLGSVSGSAVETDTEVNSIKIYMTRTFDTNKIGSQFAQNIFLDRINPMFGYKHGASYYVIRNELRYDDIYLGGDFTIPAGVYQVYLRKSGTTTDGKHNITITIE
jgi:parallel beta-helix repeat protein